MSGAEDGAVDVARGLFRVHAGGPCFQKRQTHLHFRAEKDAPQ